MTLEKQRRLKLAVEADRWVTELPTATAEQWTKFIEWLKQSELHAREYQVAAEFSRWLSCASKGCRHSCRWGRCQIWRAIVSAAPGG